MSILNKVFDVMGFIEREDDDEEMVQLEKNVVPMEKPEVKPVSKVSNLVSFQQPRELTVVNSQTQTNVKVVLQEPNAFDEAQSIADNLLNKRAVVINIEECHPDIAAKIIDFIGGVVYAIDGSIQKVSQGIILAAPPNIDITSELKQQLADSDTEVFSWVTRYNKRGDA